MSLFRREPEPDSLKLGREHAVDVEMHYASGADGWWYQGRLWLNETKPVHEYEFNPILRDPRNAKVIEALKKPHVTIEEVAQSRAVPVWVAREVARAMQHAGTPHVLRIYGLNRATKPEERILVTIDQDLVAEAPMIPYPDTAKGQRNQMIAMLVLMVLLDIVLVAFAIGSISSSTAYAYQPQALSSNVTATLEALTIPGSLIGMYMYMSRQRRVLKMDIQPLLESLEDSHTEAVYLVNSQKTPAAHYIARILNLDPGAVRELTEEVARFQSDVVGNLQDHGAALREELDQAKVVGIMGMQTRVDMHALGVRGSRGSGEVNWATVTVVIVLAIIVTAVGVWAAMGGAGVAP